jgi:hypothetical protein
MSSSNRQAAQFLLALGYAGGAVLLGFLLFEDEVNRTAARTLGSVPVVVLTSLTLIAGIRLARRTGWSGLIGALTVVASLAALILLIEAIWSAEFSVDPKRAGLTAILTLGLGGISVILDSAHPADSAGLRLLRNVTALAMVALATLGILAVLEVDISIRALGVTGALFLIGALSLPIARVAWSSPGA